MDRKFNLYEQFQIERFTNLLNDKNIQIKRVEVYDDKVLINAIYWTMGGAYIESDGDSIVEWINRKLWDEIYKNLNKDIDIEINRYKILLGLNN